MVEGVAAVPRSINGFPWPRCWLNDAQCFRTQSLKKPRLTVDGKDHWNADGRRHRLPCMAAMGLIKL